jgi:hypothetical protein
MLLLKTCGTAAKIDESYQKRLPFFSVTKHWYMWLRVNLTRNHITKHRIIFKYLGPRANLISD